MPDLLKLHDKNFVSNLKRRDISLNSNLVTRDGHLSSQNRVRRAVLRFIKAFIGSSAP